MTRLALIHAVYIAMAPIDAAFERLWPDARRVNLIDDALSPDLERLGTLDERMFKRVRGLADLAVDAGADAILFTCSAFGPAIESAAKGLSIPILKPNEAMFEAALDRGRRIGMLATFSPAIGPMEEEFKEAASRRQGGTSSIETFCVPDAIAAAKRGDIAMHNDLVAKAASRFVDHDAIMLAHFSTSTAREAVEAVVGRSVLTAPEAAVLHLKRVLELAVNGPR